MAAPVGNQFWKSRSKHGREKIFSDPKTLWAACEEYFLWNQENPLYADKVNFYQGVATHEPEIKMRAMTITALCLFLDIDESTWRRWKIDNDFCGIVAKAEMVIYSQKFEGAAADLLNQNIISRELGLIDNQYHKHGGDSDQPVEVKYTIEVVDVK